MDEEVPPSEPEWTDMSDDVVRTVPAVLALFGADLRLRHMTDDWWRESAAAVGRPRESCIGARVDDLYAPSFEHAPDLIEQYERAARGETFVRPVEAWPAPHGFALLRTTIRPWRDGAEVLGCCAVVDIERRVRISPGACGRFALAAIRAQRRLGTPEAR